MENPSLHVLQVSTCLHFVYIYFTDTDKVDYTHFGLILAGFDPSLRGGVKIEKIAIAPERGARSFRPFGHVS